VLPHFANQTDSWYNGISSVKEMTMFQIGPSIETATMIPVGSNIKREDRTDIIVFTYWYDGGECANYRKVSLAKLLDDLGFTIADCKKALMQSKP
jgi:hypothetical protein